MAAGAAADILTAILHVDAALPATGPGFCPPNRIGRPVGLCFGGLINGADIRRVFASLKFVLRIVLLRFGIISFVRLHRYLVLMKQCIAC
jgi:hypothetical protein